MLSRTRAPLAVLALVEVLCAAGQPWKDKKISEWTEADARRVLGSSPWAKTVTPQIGSPPDLAQRGGRSGVMGGRGRRGGGGYGVGGVDSQGPSIMPTEAPPTLTLRWESALPVRAGEMKAGETEAPSVDEGHYAIAVYGVPRYLAAESKNLPAGLKKHASLKREGKKDIKPDSVEVLERDDGPVYVFLFPRSVEIVASDVVEFAAQIGRLKFAESFAARDMMCEGKLEL
jgi:hypothetical protein